MSAGPMLLASEVEPGHVVYLVEDTATGPVRVEWCERVADGFAGDLLGAGVVVQALQLPADGRRVEHAARSPADHEPDPESWLYRPWLIVDIETTGFREPKIIELGAVIMHMGRVIEHRSGLFDPGKPIDPRASLVHGIYDQDLRGRLKITDVNPKSGRTPVSGLDALCAKHDVRALVGYNALTSDLPIMRRDIGPRWSELEAGIALNVDVLVVVRQVYDTWRGDGRYKLRNVAARLELHHEEPGVERRDHSAVWDSVLCGRVLWAMRDHLPTDDAVMRRQMMSKAARARAAEDDVRKSHAAPPDPTPQELFR